MRIYRYRIVSDAYTTYRARGDEDAPITELCTIDGITYISGPDELPPQPEQITVESVELTDDLREQIKRASPHVRLINARVVERIRSRYSMDDELGILRAGTPEDRAAYDAWVEECREWGRQQKAELGL